MATNNSITSIRATLTQSTTSDWVAIPQIAALAVYCLVEDVCCAVKDTVTFGGSAVQHVLGFSPAQPPAESVQHPARLKMDLEDHF